MYCDICKAAYEDNVHSSHIGATTIYRLDGIDIYDNFVTPSEETEIYEEICKSSWSLSQSGRRKQVWLTPTINIDKCTHTHTYIYIYTLHIKQL